MSTTAQAPIVEKVRPDKTTIECTPSNGTSKDDSCLHIDIDNSPTTQYACAIAETPDILHPSIPIQDTIALAKQDTAILLKQAKNKNNQIIMSDVKGRNAKSLPSGSPDNSNPPRSSKGNFHKVQRLSLLVGFLAYFFALTLCALVLLYEVNVFDDVSPEKLALPVASDLVHHINGTVPCAEVAMEYTEHVVETLEKSGYQNMSEEEIADYVEQYLGYTPDEDVENALVLTGDTGLLSMALGLVISDYLAGNYEMFNDTQQLREDILAAVGDDATLCLQVATILALHSDSNKEFREEIEELTNSIGEDLADALGLDGLFVYTRETYLLQAKEDGLDRMFIVCAILFIAAELLFVMVGVFVYKYRNEPEVFSRHRFFLIHFNLAGVLVPPAALLMVGVSTAQLSVSYDTNNTLYTIMGAFLTLITLLGPVSAVFLRQRFMYQVFWRSTPNTSDAHYFIMMPWYLLLTIVIVATDILAHYFDDERNATQFIAYTPIYVVIACLAVEFSYYVWRVRHSSHVFVDVWQAYRFLLAWILSFFIFHFAIAHRNSIALGSVSATLHLVACLFAAYLDFFLLPLLKVFGRRNGLRILQGYDFAGCTLGIDFNHVELVLDDPEACTLLLEFLRKRFCSEGVEFLIELRDLQLLFEVENKPHAECWERVKHISDVYIYPHHLNISSLTQKTLSSKLRELRAHLDTAEEKSKASPRTSRRKTHNEQRLPQAGQPPYLAAQKSQPQLQSQHISSPQESHTTPPPSAPATLVASQSYAAFSHTDANPVLLRSGSFDGGFFNTSRADQGHSPTQAAPMSMTCPTTRARSTSAAGYTTQLSAPGVLHSDHSSHSTSSHRSGPLSPIARSLHRAHSGIKNGLGTLDSQLKHVHSGDGVEYEQALKNVNWGEVICWFSNAKKEITDLLLGGQLREFCTQAQMRLLIQKRIAQNNTLMEHKIVQNNTTDDESTKDSPTQTPQPVRKVGSVVEMGILDIPRHSGAERAASVSKKNSTIKEELCTTLVHEGAADGHASIYIEHDTLSKQSTNSLDQDTVSTSNLDPESDAVHIKSEAPSGLLSNSREITASVTRVLSARLDQLTPTRHNKRTSHPHPHHHPSAHALALSHTSRSLSALPVYLRTSLGYETPHDRDGEQGKGSGGNTRARRGSMTGPGTRPNTHINTRNQQLTQMHAQTHTHTRTHSNSRLMSSNVRMSAESVLWHELAYASQNSFGSLGVVRTSSAASASSVGKMEKGCSVGSNNNAPPAIGKPDCTNGKAEKIPTSNVARAASIGGLPSSSLCAFARDIARVDKNCTNVSNGNAPNTLLSATQTIPHDNGHKNGRIMSVSIAEAFHIGISDDDDSQDNDSTTCV